MKLITVKTYNLSHEAHIDKGRLEAEGLFVVLKDELISQVYNFSAQTLGGIQLQVREDQVAKAVEILNNEDIIDISDAFQHTKCPNCASLNTHKKKMNSILYVCSILLFGIPFFFMGGNITCADCNTTFKA